jgi:hypothetical protein
MNTNWYKKCSEENEKTVSNLAEDLIKRLVAYGMSPEEIERAIKSGYLERIIGEKPPSSNTSEGWDDPSFWGKKN